MSTEEESNRNLQLQLFQEARKDLRLYVIGILSMFLQVQTQLLSPLVIGLFIDQVLTEGRTDNIYWLGGAVIAIAVISGIFGFGNRYFNDKAGFKTEYRLRNRMFDKIQSQSLSFLNQQESGKLMAKMTSDLNIIKSYLSREFRLGLNAIYYFVSIGITIYITQASFMVIFFVLLPVLVVISFIYGKKARPLFRARRQQYSILSTHIQEKIYAIETVRSFAQEEYEKSRFRKSNREYLQLFVKSVVIRNLTLPLAVLLVSLGSVSILYIGGYEIITHSLGIGDVTLGQLVQFNLYMITLTTPTRLLGDFLTGYTQTNVSAKRVFDLLNSENTIVDPVDPVSVDRFDGKIEFDHVSFVYEQMRPILNDISISVEPGEIIGIIGGTGSGKSTLIQLIPRFFDPVAGEIRIDGIDIRRYRLEELRRNIGIVSQETFLFSRTIRENIAFGKPDAQMEDIERVARIAQAHDFIMEFPDGYDSIVGERGITLSGGQQQRLSIARALLIDPTILIFDDSTASVDATTESEIQEAIEQLVRDRTTIIISQKISSLRKAKQILVLDMGEIIEQGTHEELLALGGIYQEINNTQEDRELQAEIEIILGGKE